jgi:DeoR/GlpR family transcriptional regulator of sugar metabolism
VLAATLRVRSRRCAFAVDSAKFSRGDAQLVMPLARVDAVATNLSPPEDIIRAFAEEGVEVVLPATCAGPGARDGR